jgi:hypothetical protein
MSTTAIAVIDRAKVDLINEEHRLVEGSYRTALTHALNCGRMLAGVKAELGHGRFGSWVEDHFDGSERTARLYMQLADAP